VLYIQRMSERESRLRLEHREVPDFAAVCPECRRRLPHHTVSEAWVEVPLGEDWIAAYRIVPKGGQPAVAEVRLFPDEPKRSPGHWSKEPASVPVWGLPGTLLGKLRLTHALRKFGELVEDADNKTDGYFSAQVLKRFGLRKSDRHASARPGRGGRDDLFYAIWAAAYVERLLAGDRTPVRSLGEDPPIELEGAPSPLSRNTVRGILADARSRQLLTTAPPGKAGGELTTKASKILATLDPDIV